jgi:hypothetical protein
MVSHLFYYQLALLALVWLFVLLHVADARRGEQGDAGGNCKTPVEWPALFTCHSNSEKPPYACQTATRHV